MPAKTVTATGVALLLGGGLLFAATGSATPVKPDFAAKDLYWVYVPALDCWARGYNYRGIAAQWSGACTDGKISGAGTLTETFPVKDYFDTLIGTFQDGELEGQATMKQSDGVVMTGPFHLGRMMDGDWDITWSGGMHYKGPALRGRPNGDGHADFPDGSSYDGHFVVDSVAGKGVLTFSGGTLEGQFSQRTPYGIVTLRRPGQPPLTGVIQATHNDPAIKNHLPEYPTLLIKWQPYMSVTLFATVMADGSVTNAVVAMPNPDMVGYRGLKKDIEDATKDWRFIPATINGTPVTLPLQMTLNYGPRQNYKTP